MDSENFDDSNDSLSDLEDSDYLKKRRIALSNLSKSQNQRYQNFLASKFKPETIQRIVKDVTGANAQKSTAILIGSIAKVFVGEIVEESRILMFSRKDQNNKRKRQDETNDNAVDRDNPIPPDVLKMAFDSIKSKKPKLNFESINFF
ncbi:transcription initiation factor TFIID subunit 11 [Bonamia ostreae]|uniref:Transcription initiation factor TFIID subunit 11 n=1 Tax=Bonamia ostreae TaxID=126728 RepID=A0ABV2AJK0_9EUKA